MGEQIGVALGVAVSLEDADGDWDVGPADGATVCVQPVNNSNKANRYFIGTPGGRLPESDTICNLMGSYPQAEYESTEMTR